ncbi:ferredoxin [Mycobacterium camsae]|uniref:ferredoxin n=1 Tax=Mycobacterium gordonae TaxID=1778 RepID=UPI0032169AEF
MTWPPQATRGAGGPPIASLRCGYSIPTVKSGGVMHVNVDYEVCEGHGQCLLAAPEVFDLPDGADQVVVLDPDPPEAQRQLVIQAAAMCPAQAIRMLN